MPTDFVRFTGAKCDGSMNEKLKLYTNVPSMKICVHKCVKTPECMAVTFSTSGGDCKLFEECNHFFMKKSGYESAVLNRVSRDSMAKYWMPIKETACAGGKNIDCMKVNLGTHLKPSVRQCKVECKKSKACEAYQYITGTSLCVLYRQRTEEEIRTNQLQTWFAPAAFRPGGKAIIQP